MEKKVIVGVSLCAVAGVCVAGFLLTHHKKPAEADGSASSEVMSDVASSAASVAEAEGREFKEIEFEGASMVGRAEYQQLTDFKNQWEFFKNELGLTKMNTSSGPMTYATGHQVYKSSDDGERYIVSGFSPIKLFEGNISDTTFIREEDTGERIYVFPNQSEEAAFHDDWESGQRILSGTTHGEHGDIIVDGRLIHAKYTEKNGDICFSLVDVASAVDSSLYYEEQLGYVAVRPNEFVTVQVPTNAANADVNRMLNSDGSKFTFNSWAGDKFTIDKVPVLDYDTTLIAAKYASKMFGWRMYTDGDVLSIVSDPLNVTDNTVVYTSGSMGLTSVLEKDEFGNEVVNTYDSNGTLISSTPFDGNYSDYDLEESSDSTAAEEAVSADDMNEPASSEVAVG